MSKIIILSAGPGLPEIVNEYGHSSDWIPNILSKYSIDFKVKKAYENDFGPIDGVDGWIITGSKYSVYDDIAWIQNLQKHLINVFSTNKPVLGICFGHQLIAKALGGKVVKNHLGWELGSFQINLTDKGKNSSLFNGINELDYFYESHQDVVSKMPENATLLASNKKGNQSFKYKNIYGVQFHPEFSFDITKKLIDVRLRNGIKIDDDKLVNCNSGEKILHNFIQILEERK